MMTRSSEKWPKGASKIDGQFNGGHVKWDPETATEVDNSEKATMITFN